MIQEDLTISECKVCHTENPTTANYCKHCGNQFDKEYVVLKHCKHCGAGNPSFAVFCKECGKQLVVNKTKSLHIIYLIVILLLFGGEIFTMVKYNQLGKKLVVSQNKIKELEEESNGYKVSYNTQFEKYSSLENRYNGLWQDYNQLQTNYNNLQGKYTDLESKYNSNESIILPHKEPFIILDIEIKNDGQEYNQTIYAYKSTRLTGKIRYVGLENQQNIKLKIKLYCNGELSYGSDTWYRSGYSFDGQLSTYTDVVSTTEIGHWGHTDGSPWPSGDYRYEVWYGDKCIGVKHFKVY